MTQAPLGRRASRKEACRESGFMLAATIGILLFFAVVAVAVLGYTVTVMRVTTFQARDADDRRAADSAMEVVIGRLRADPTGVLGSGADGASCAGAASVYSVELPEVTGSTTGPDTIEVSCTVSAAPSGRGVDLSARRSGELLGSARVRFVDTPSPGYRLVTCDWELSGSARPLADCP